MINRIMLLTVALCLSPTVLSLSLQIPPTTFVKECRQQLIGSVTGLVIATSLPLSTPAVEVIKIDADVPALIQIASDNKDVVIKLAQQTAGVVKISDYPKSWLNFVRDVAAGDVYVEINGIPIDISILSAKGAIDIDLSTEVGDLSLTVASDVIPKLPFLSKRVVPISKASTTTAVLVDKTSSGAIVEEQSTKVVRTRSAAAIQANSNNKDTQRSSSILDQPFFLDLFQQGWTIKQVLGTTSLGLGIAYASSYAYYVKSQEDEERAAAEKKQNVAAAKKAAAVPTIQVDRKVEEKVAKVKVVKAETPSEVKAVAVTPGKDKKGAAKSVIPDTKPAPTKAAVSVASNNTEPAKKKSRGFLRFWKKN